jgi:NAD(P)H-hydrate repair Nnr-like enzyme with NAD(P)H-hydrate epimerase domain
MQPRDGCWCDVTHASGCTEMFVGSRMPGAGSLTWSAAPCCLSQEHNPAAHYVLWGGGGSGGDALTTRTRILLEKPIVTGFCTLSIVRNSKY